MADSEPQKRPTLGQRFRRNLIAGILTIIPLYVTWLALSFLVRMLVKAGEPLIEVMADAAPSTWEPWFEDIVLQKILALLVVVGGVTFLGWISSQVIGRKAMAGFDSIMNRIPLVQQIYGGAKKLVTSLQHKPDGVQRVVLIDFPSPEMKTVGFVTRTLTDTDTGQRLAAVYVPTTPNPTSGYLEIVPFENVTSTTWTVDEAMNFIVSGGAVAPDSMNYTHGVGDAPQLDEHEPPEAD